MSEVVPLPVECVPPVGAHISLDGVTMIIERRFWYDGKILVTVRLPDDSLATIVCSAARSLQELRAFCHLFGAQR